MGKIDKEERQKVYEMFDGHCAYCGKKIAYKDMQVDHVKPIWRGHAENYLNKGTDDISNYMPACRSCNFRKGTFSVEQFRNEIRMQAKHIVERTFQVRQSIDYGLISYADKPIVFYFERHKKKEK